MPWNKSAVFGNIIFKYIIFPSEQITQLMEVFDQTVVSAHSILG